MFLNLALDYMLELIKIQKSKSKTKFENQNWKGELKMINANEFGNIMNDVKIA